MREINAKSRWRDKYEIYPSGKYFKEFKKKYPEYKSIDNSRLKKIIEVFNDELTNMVLGNKDGIELPYGLGNIFIMSYKKASKGVDYNLTKKYGRVVNYQNLDTDGRIAKIVYSNRYTSSPFYRRGVWNFQPADTFKTKTAKAFRNQYEKYHVLQKGMSIKDYLQKKNK